jgi:hypothetical protein
VWRSVAVAEFGFDMHQHDPSFMSRDVPAPQARFGKKPVHAPRWPRCWGMGTLVLEVAKLLVWSRAHLDMVEARTKGNLAQHYATAKARAKAAAELLQPQSPEEVRSNTMATLFSGEERDS